jgi:hypothetical protein
MSYKPEAPANGETSLALQACVAGLEASTKKPPLPIEQILAWADAHYQRTGKWPRISSGPIAGETDQTWIGVDVALRNGCRGLRGGSSLAQLLTQERGARNHRRLPALTEAQILAWAEAHFLRTNRWPSTESGPIPETTGETWAGVNHALKVGRRGLTAGGSVTRLLVKAGKKRNQGELPRLTEEQIKVWAEAHFGRKRRWPQSNSGRVADAPEESWLLIDKALGQGNRGLPGGTTLARLLKRHRYHLLVTTYVPIRGKWAPPLKQESVNHP